MGIGQDYQSQRFLSLGPKSQSSKSRNCPNDFCPSPKSPRDLCPMDRLWDSQNSLRLQIPIELESQLIPKLGIWLSKGFFILGLSQRYLSQSEFPGFVSLLTFVLSKTFFGVLNFSLTRSCKSFCKSRTRYFIIRQRLVGDTCLSTSAHR